MNLDTYEVRKGAKLLNDDRMAAAIADWLVANANITTLQEIDETPINDEIRVGLFGDDYDEDVAVELNETVGEMTRPRGPVYYALDNGSAHLSLCTTRVRRKLTTEDGSVIVTKNTRFVSDDADIVAHYRIEPQMQRLERTMERISATIAEDVERIPALAGKVPGMIARANATMQRELPSSTNGGS